MLSRRIFYRYIWDSLLCGPTKLSRESYTKLAVSSGSEDRGQLSIKSNKTISGISMLFKQRVKSLKTYPFGVFSLRS